MKNLFVGKKNLIIGICAQALTVVLLWAIIFSLSRFIMPYGADYAYMSADFTAGGGRMLYTLLMASLLKNGTVAYFAVNSIFIALTMWVMSLFLGKSWIKRVVAMLFFLALFFCVSSAKVQSQGAYWATASTLYLWPLLPFLASIYFLWKFPAFKGTKLFYVYGAAMVLTAALAAFGNEMYGILFFLVALFHAIYYRKSFSRPIWIFLVVAALLAVVGSTMLLFPPRDAPRGSTTKMASFTEAVVQIYSTLCIGKTDVGISNIVFGILLTLVCAYNLFMFGKERKRLRFRILFFAWMIVLVLASIIVPNHSRVMAFLLVGFVVASEIASFILRYIQTKRIEWIPFLLVVFISAYARALTLSFNGRDALPFLMVIGLFIAQAFLDVGLGSFKIEVRWKRYVCRGALAALAFTTALIGAVNYREELIAYSQSQTLWSLNEKNIDYAIRSGAKEVALFQYPKGYSGPMPYNEGGQEAEALIRSRYSIPEDMVITWMESTGGVVNKDAYKAGVTLAESEKIEGFHVQNTEGIWAAGRSFAYVAAGGAYYDLVIANPLDEDNSVSIYFDGLLNAYCTIPAKCALTYKIDLRTSGASAHYLFSMGKSSDAILGGYSVSSFVWEANSTVTDYNVRLAQTAAKTKPERLDFIGYGIVEMGTYLFTPDYHMIGEALASEYGLGGTKIAYMPGYWGFFDKGNYDAGTTLLTAARLHGAYSPEGNNLWTSNHFVFVLGKQAHFITILYNPWNFDIDCRVFRNGELDREFRVAAGNIQTYETDTTAEEGNTHYFFTYSAFRRPAATGDQRNLGLLISEGGI